MHPFAYKWPRQAHHVQMSCIVISTNLRTFWPSSQLIHRSPLVRKQATACLARWWIHPSCLSWVMMASMKGKPVLALKDIQNIHNEGKSMFGLQSHQEGNNKALWQHHLTKLALIKTQYLSPCSQILRVCVPIHLGTHWVSHHLVKVGDTQTSCVEELSPQELAMEGYGGVRVLPLQHKHNCLTVSEFKNMGQDFIDIPISNLKNNLADFSEQKSIECKSQCGYRTGTLTPW